MAKKRFKPKNIELRYQTYYAVLTVPENVRGIIGKRKFSKSLETGTERTAELRAAAYVLKWQAQIDAARHRLANPETNPILESAKQLRDMFLEAQNSSDSWRMSDIRDLAMDESYRIAHEQKDDTLGEAFRDVATNKANLLKDLLPQFEKTELQRGLDRKTVEQSVRDVEPLCKDFLTAKSITPEWIQRFIEYITEPGRFSRSSVIRHIYSYRKFYDFLIQIREVPKTNENPFMFPESFRRGSKKKYSANHAIGHWATFQPAEVEHLYRKATIKNDKQLADLIFVGAYTGARIEEICSIRCHDIDLVTQSIHIKDSKTESGKRVIPIHSDLRDTIERLRSDSKDSYLISGLTFNKYKDRSNAVGKRFGRLKNAENFGSKHVFHSIRKTFVTQLENSGIGENIAADLVGHKKPRITYGLYSDGASLEVKRDAIEKVKYNFK
jgi:integrase